MYLVKTPKIIQRLFPSFTWNFPEKERTIYLTFDDGPVEETTPFILEQLAHFNAKATFFCVGNNIVENRALYDQILKSGHAVGSHGYTHLSGWKTSLNEYVSDIHKGAAHVDSTLFRPPYGKLTYAQAKVLSQDYDIIMWDVLSGDFDFNLSADACYKNVIKSAKNGSIVVMHDGQKYAQKLFELLPKVLQYFNEQGYTFKAISSLSKNRRKIA